MELELGCDNSPYLKEIIYGKHNDTKYDGIHMNGIYASRHFTYRAAQAIKSIISKPFQLPWQQRKNKNSKPGGISARMPAGWHGQDNHSDCEQARYQHQSASGSHGSNNVFRNYSDVVKNMETRYSVPTQNFYNPLNC